MQVQQSDDDKDNGAGVFDETILPVGEHIEEVSENGQKVRRKGIYLLPNLFTTGALFAGFYAIVSGMNGRYELAAVAIFVAMILDGLDGRVARLTNTQSAFGAEYDSLADMVSFGVAPALVAFSWALSSLGKFGWAASFIYVAGAALRLARFNTQIETADKRYFTGLASPAAAALVAGLVWVCNEDVVADMSIQLAVLVALVTASAGILMVTNIPYHSFKGIDFKGRVPFVMMLLVVLIFGVLSIYPSGLLLLVFGLYALSGPAQMLVAKFRR
jgi:CDP-diacylglycerol--serine O-phosphatidyltransferase